MSRYDHWGYSPHYGMGFQSPISFEGGWNSYDESPYGYMNNQYNSYDSFGSSYSPVVKY